MGKITSNISKPLVLNFQSYKATFFFNFKSNLLYVFSGRDQLRFKSVIHWL